jgi:hypothetical protein
MVALQEVDQALDGNSAGKVVYPAENGRPLLEDEIGSLVGALGVHLVDAEVVVRCGTEQRTEE